VAILLAFAVSESGISSVSVSLGGEEGSKILNAGNEFIGSQDLSLSSFSSSPKVPEMQLVQLADARRLRCQLGGRRGRRGESKRCSRHIPPRPAGGAAAAGAGGEGPPGRPSGGRRDAAGAGEEGRRMYISSPRSEARQEQGASSFRLAVPTAHSNSAIGISSCDSIYLSSLA